MANIGEKKNIIVGAAEFFIGKSDATKPEAVANVRYSKTLRDLPASSGIRTVGYTQEGVELAYEPEYGDVEVDQLLDSARIHKTSMRVMINTTFAEATLENLIVSWGQADSTLASSGSETTLQITGGELGEAPIERQLIIVGNGKEKDAGGAYNERTYHALRAISTESTSFALRRSEATVFPVSFRLLPSDEDGNPYGSIRERKLS